MKKVNLKTKKVISIILTTFLLLGVFGGVKFILASEVSITGEYGTMTFQGSTLDNSGNKKLKVQIYVNNVLVNEENYLFNSASTGLIEFNPLNVGYSVDHMTLERFFKNGDYEFQVYQFKDNNINLSQQYDTTLKVYFNKPIITLNKVANCNVELSNATGKRYYNIDLSATILNYNQVNIRDYIDPRFQLTDSEGNVLSDGASIDGGSGIYHGVEHYIEWTNVTGTINKTLTVKAKEDFIGGNAIPTNTSLSGAYINNSLFKAFNIPTVNVPVSSKSYALSEDLFYGIELSDADLYTKFLDLIKDDQRLTSSVNKLSAASISVDYMYTGTNDVVGTLTLEKTNNGGTYYFEVVYTPYFVSDRLTANETYDEPNCSEIIETSIDSGTYNYTVVKGDLEIVKTIDAQYTSRVEPKSDQSFIFRIERYTDESYTTPVEIFYETISFSANENVTEKKAVIQGLKWGYYKVIEESSWSWKYNDSSMTDSEIEGSNPINIMDGIVYIGNKLSSDSSVTTVDGVSYTSIDHDYFGEQGVTDMLAKIKLDCTKKYTHWIGGDVANLIVSRR